MKGRWRKTKARSVISPSVARRWLGEFHDDGQERLRVLGKAFIPKPNEQLLGLKKVNWEFVGWVQSRSTQLVATLDLDATLLETSKSDALYCYQGYRAYQPLNVWWAEVCFVPDAIAHSRNAPSYRYIATREVLKNQPLPGLESEQLSLPFQTVSSGGVTYKLFGVVTNLGWDGNDVIQFHDGRSGKCEEAHKVLKEDFAGGKMPSNEFGANAAWWQIGGVWAKRRMKAIRFLLISVPGRVVEKARGLYLRLSRDHPALDLVIRMRVRIRELGCGPPLAA
jgi:hypothetical protein